MKCPHCAVAFSIDGCNKYLDKDKDGMWFTVNAICPECKRIVIYIQKVIPRTDIIADPSQFGKFNDMIDNYEFYNRALGARSKVAANSILVYPKGSSRPPCPPEIPEDIAEDYNEACLVLPDSPKASAALSRRCLQAIFQQAGFNQYNLSDQIEEAMKQLPPYLAEQLDAVRNIGNFAAHPRKSQSTGEIVPVEPHEAEWNLDIIEALFEHYYVLPVQVKKKREALDKKLADTGQKPMK